MIINDHHHPDNVALQYEMPNSVYMAEPEKGIRRHSPQTSPLSFVQEVCTEKNYEFYKKDSKATPRL